MSKKEGPKGNTKDMIKALRRYDHDVSYLKRRIKSAKAVIEEAEERMALFIPKLDKLVSQGPPAKEVKAA